MTTFQDGPAADQKLMLKRAVMFLRITESNGKFDALDQLSDTVQQQEKLFAYRIVGVPGHCHIRAGGGRSGFYAIATYKLVEPQPLDAQMRDNEAWIKWVEDIAVKERL